jgi:hypothetical protein
MKEPKIITQQDIDKVWGNADFGNVSRIDVIKYGLLKAAGGWYQGNTSTNLLLNLDLIKKSKTGKTSLTLKGHRNLYNFFKDKDKNI